MSKPSEANTAIAVALIGVAGAVLTALINNADKIFPASEGDRATAPVVVDAQSAENSDGADTTGCDRLVFDLDSGTLNGVRPIASPNEIKQQFPCSTSAAPEGANTDYGSRVFSNSHGFYFYTYRDVLQVRKGFSGTVKPDLLGHPPAVVSARLSTPSQAGRFWFYERDYGCLGLEFDDNRLVSRINVRAGACPS